MTNRRKKLIGCLAFCAFFSLLLVALLPEPHAPKIDPKYRRSIEDMKKLRTACLAYKKDVSFIPNEIKELYANTLKIENWKGPYMTEEVKVNPWGNPYQIILYEATWENGKKTYHFLIYGKGSENSTLPYYELPVEKTDTKPENANMYCTEMPHATNK